MWLIGENCIRAASGAGFLKAILSPIYPFSEALNNRVFPDCLDDARLLELVVKLASIENCWQREKIERIGTLPQRQAFGSEQHATRSS